ncbi:MAG: endopeptidase IV [Legionella sp.]|nr:MAG: endopeptidase IV [Legionella sp.]
MATKVIIPWFCLAALTHGAFALTGTEAYRQEDYANAAVLFKAKAKLDPIEDYYLGRMYLYGYGVLKSNTLAQQSFKAAAEKGVLPAQLLMAKLELFQNHNPEQALFWFKKAAKSNDTSAQMYCAGAYLFGFGTKKNSDAAREFYIPAARSGNAIAQRTLAENFLNTRQPANQKMGLVWLQKAAALRDPEAEIMLAELYRKGDKVSQNTDQAKQLLEDALAQGYVPAVYQMGVFEQQQSHVKDAQTWYLKASSLHYLPAQLALAELYLDPKSELYSVQNGFLWMLKAAQSGSEKAQHLLAAMYQKGQGVAADEGLAAEWEATARKTQESNSSGTYAEQHMVQWLTCDKEKKLTQTAYRLPGIYSNWKNQDALQENIYNFPPKMNALARNQIYKSQFKMMDPNAIPINQYYDALMRVQAPSAKEALVLPYYPIRTKSVAAQDAHDRLQYAQREGYDYLTHLTSSPQAIEYPKEFKLLLNQAILGDSAAQFNVAQMYQQGLGVEKSIDQAIKFYLMAAAQNDLAAKYQLGLIYFQGSEGTPDYQLALDWWMDAAFKGNQYAQYALARLYENGYTDPNGKEVIAANPEQSFAMYQLSAVNNYGLAQYRLAEIMVRQKGTDFNVADLELRRKLIKGLYQGAVNYGVDQAKLPLAFYNAMDADPVKQAQAFTDAQQAANAGSVDAAFLLGIMYDRGIATEKSRDQAIHWYEQSAQNPMSAFILGTYAAEGTGLAKNLEKAVNYLQFSVNQEFAPADFNIAVLKQQQGEAFLPYLDKAVALGLHRAGLLLADYYMTSASNDQQLHQARDLYERFAKQGDPNAQLKLGYMYEQGLGIPQDYNQALTWYTAAAEKGSYKAQYLLGKLYHLGYLGAAPDYTLARQWYALAQTHYAPAAVAYGFIDEMVDDDYLHALNEYQLAADLGDPVAAYDLGLIYEKGKNQLVDLEKAKELYTQAANQGVVKAMVSLGILYAKDHKYDDAVSWLNKAVAQDDADAEYQLGWMAEKGMTRQSSMSEAIKHYQSSAGRGNARAMLALARLYQSGSQVVKNTQQSVEYYTLLARQDYPEAQYQLAKFCFSGFVEGCTEQQGKNLLEKAQQNGYRDAGQLLRFYTAKSQDGVSYIESIIVSQGQRTQDKSKS